MSIENPHKTMNELVETYGFEWALRSLSIRSSMRYRTSNGFSIHDDVAFLLAGISRLYYTYPYSKVVMWIIKRLLWLLVRKG